MIKKKIANITNKLYKQQKISVKTKMELISNEDIAKIRGQPKIHKQNHPMKIITSARHTITTPLSKLTYTIIKPLRKTIKNTRIIINTSQFVEQIHESKLEQNENMASLDIEDLFNNIPLIKAIEITINRIEE